MSSDPIDRGVLPDLLGYQLRRAQQHVFQHFATHLAGHGVTPGQVGLLVLVSRNPGISQTALARAAGVERSTLGEALDALLARELVARTPSPRDRRSYALALTGAGERFVEALLPAIRAHEAAVAAALSEEERRALLELLGRLQGGP